MKRVCLLTALLALLLAVYCAEATAATDGMCGPNLRWTLDDAGKLTISGTGEMTSHPWSIGAVKSVVIQDGVNSICHSAFLGCNALKSAEIPDSVTAIDIQAFCQCTGLESVKIGAGVKTIGEQAFNVCTALKSVKIPDSVTVIGAGAFADCIALKSVEIPGSVTAIGIQTFCQCSGLESVKIGAGVKTIGDQAFINCTALKSVEIPDSVTSIGNYAFYGCTAMTSVTMGKDVKSIGEHAFYLCSSLADIWYPGTQAQWDSIEKGYNWDYQTASLTVLCIADHGKTPSDPCTIRSEQQWDKLSELIAGGLDTSGRYFKLEADISVTKMLGTSDHPFGGNFDGGGHTLTFNKTTTEEVCAPFRYVRGAAFEKLRVEGKITTSNRYAAGLAGIAETSCTITDCVSSICIDSSWGKSASHAGFVSEGSSVVITGCVFNGSIIGGKSTYCGGFLGWSNDDNSNCVNCVFDASEINTVSNTGTFIRNMSAAQNSYYTRPIGQGRDKGKQMYAVDINDGNSYGFGRETVYIVSGITAYPVGLKYKGTYCAGEGDAVSVTVSVPGRLPENRQLYGMKCYKGIQVAVPVGESGGVYTFTMPGQKVSIFADVDWAEDIVVKSGEIADSQFSVCDRIKTVTVGPEVTRIGNNAFHDCPNLTAVTMEFDNIEQDGITVTRGVKEIGDHAFNGCTSLASVTIPESVTQIGDYAFDTCNSLKDVIYGGTEEQWQAVSIGGGNEPLTGATIHFHEHKWKKASYKWAGDNSEVTGESVCSENAAHRATETVSASAEVTKEPGCTEKGEKTWTSAAFGSDAFTVQTKKEEIPAKGHAWGGKPAFAWAEDFSSCKATFTCGACCEKRTVDAAVTYRVTLAPTTLKPGEGVYTATAKLEGKTAKDTRTVEIPLTDRVITLSASGKHAPETVYIGETVRVDPAYATDAGLSGIAFKSAKKKIAGIDTAGHLTLNKAGKTTVTVTAIQEVQSGKKIKKKKIKATVKLTVVDPSVPVKVTAAQENALEAGKVYIGREEGRQLKAHAVSPVDGWEADGAVTWKSSSAKVVKVDRNTGLLTPVNAGTAKITATSTRNKKAKFTIPITVVDLTIPTGIKLKAEKTELMVGETAKVTYELESIDQDVKAVSTVTWKISNKKIAKIAADGTVTALKAGEVTITATTKIGKKTSEPIVLTIKASNNGEALIVEMPDEEPEEETVDEAEDAEADDLTVDEASEDWYAEEDWYEDGQEDF